MTVWLHMTLIRDSSTRHMAQTHTLQPPSGTQQPPTRHTAAPTLQNITQTVLENQTAGGRQPFNGSNGRHGGVRLTHSRHGTFANTPNTDFRQNRGRNGGPETPHTAGDPKRNNGSCPTHKTKQRTGGTGHSLPSKRG